MQHLTQEQTNILAHHQPKLSLDGNMWCFLKGKDLQEGIAGFGATLNEAAIQFTHEIKSNYNGKEYDHAFDDDTMD